MKLRKKILTSLLVILVIVGAVIGIILTYLGTIVAGVMRTVGTEAVGTELKVKSVGISLLSGNLSINRLAVANPAGYKAQDAFSVASFKVDLDVDSLFSDTIVVNKIEIADIVLDFEPTLKGSNLNDIKKNIMQFTQREQAAEKKPAAEEKTGTPKKSRKIIIKSFILNQGTVMVSSAMLQQSVSVTLNRLELNNLGQESTIGTACGRIFDAVLKQVAEAVATANIEGLNIDTLKSKLFNNLPAATENIGDGINKTIEGIKNLF
ncbi:MAG: AsmA family protein [Victivallaceae bacterium]|nr:AsmA family protein [Victivallaceae bacterium]